MGLLVRNLRPIEIDGDHHIFLLEQLSLNLKCSSLST